VHGRLDAMVVREYEAVEVAVVADQRRARPVDLFSEEVPRPLWHDPERRAAVHLDAEQYLLEAWVADIRFGREFREGELG